MMAHRMLHMPFSAVAITVLSNLILGQTRSRYTWQLLFHQQYQRFPQFNPRHSSAVNTGLFNHLGVSIRAEDPR